jgi:hypothetical protein
MLQHRRSPDHHHLGEEATMATREGSGFPFLAQPALFQHGTPQQFIPRAIPPRVAHPPP